MIHILCTQNWAAGCNPPLRSRKHTERIFVYKLYGFWFGYFINTALLVGLYKCINDKYGGTLPVLKNEIIDVCLCPAVRKRNLWFRIWALRGYFARLGTGRTSLFLTSQRMPSRYGCVHMLIQLCKYLHAVSSVGFTIDVNDSFLLPSKYRRTSLHKAYNRVFDFVKSKSTG